MKKQSFVLGAMILAICAILCKILGAIYRIPLTNILGSEGMGIYYLIFPIYSFMLTISSSSFPTAISHLVSCCVAVSNYKKANAILRASILLLSLLGTICTLIVFLLARPMAMLQSRPDVYFGYYIIAPSILFVSVLSAFRGYFQGLQNMTPSGISQIIEQIFKLAFGLLLSIKLIPYGIVYGVVGALFGITISECLAMAYLIIRFSFFKHKNAKFCVQQVQEKYSLWCLTKQIFLTVIPYMLGSIIYPLSILIDSFLVINLLVQSGLSAQVATALFGINSAIVGTMTNLPTVVSTSLAMSIVPSISASIKQRDYSTVVAKSKFSIKICLLIALPCSIVFALFSKPIVDILFSSGLSTDVFDEFSIAYGLLSISGVLVIYLCLLQVMTAILQSINKPYLPVISLAIGVSIKVLCEYIFILIPKLNIYGAVLSNMICFFVACIMDIIFVKKNISLNFSFVHMFICPVLAIIAMVLVIYGISFALNMFMSYKIATLIAFIFGAIAYIIVIFITSVFDKEEMLYFKRLRVHKK